MSNLFAKKRSAITRTVAIVLAVVLVVAVVAGEELLSNANKSTGTTTGIDLHIYEDNPVLQIDHYYPDTIYVALGANISLAVQNGDDETRVFTLSQFGVNQTIISGTAQRFSFTADKLGNFSFISPITAPSAASAGRKGPCLEGFFVVVAQNSTLLSTTVTGSGVAPSLAAAQAAANGPIGSCPAAPLTIP
jgi:Cupredoxin-like domain